MASGVLVSRASADQVSDLKAKAAAIEARISALGQQEAALSEQYDAAQLKAQQLRDSVTQAEAAVAAAQASADHARNMLKQNAVEAYVHGGNNPLASAGNGLASANQSLLRAEYENSLAVTQNDSIDQFRLAALQEQAAKAKLQVEQSAAQAQLAAVQKDRQAAVQMATQLQATEKQVNGQVAVLIAQKRAAEEAAARARALAAAAARARTVSVTLTGSFSPGRGASGAVAAAESRVGDWYQWGATGPNTFDCSGLVMWAYAQVGISLPHFSGAQYSATTHIPMSALRAGDLVFPSNPDEHVAMYVGNGEIVEAPYTGAQVHIIPMGSWFVLASRVS